MSEIIPGTYQLKAKIIQNQKLRDNYYSLILKAPQITKIARPGQFINIKIEEVFLRRPFSILKKRQSYVYIIYEIVGKGTSFLSYKKEDDILDIIGPLGNGFCFPRETKKEVILVAGGVGIAGLYFLAEELRKQNQKIIVLIGAKTKQKLICEKELKDLGCQVFISTDDGSKGFKGKVTDLFKNLLATYVFYPEIIYACGPRQMLKELREISHALKVPTWVSLDQHMACGFGACLGCSIETKTGFKRVCKEGPVFNAEELIW